MHYEKTLSLCIITKNDEGHLSKTIENMRELVDEIIIADIGSSDSTIDIAKREGALVYQLEWENSYSKVKNFCMNEAGGKWILFLQADEIIPTEEIEKFHLILKNPNAEGYLFCIVNNLQKHKITSPVQDLRLIRKRKEYRFRYRAYERIEDEALSNIKDANICIISQANTDLTNRNSSLLKLLKEDIIGYPEDCYLQYIYGIELLNQTCFEDGVFYLRKSYENINIDYLFAPHLFKCLSWALIHLQRHGEASAVLDEGIKSFPYYFDLLVLRGELKKQLQQYSEALYDLEMSLRISEHVNSMVLKSEIAPPIILEIIGELHEEVFNYNKALVYLQQAYASNMGNIKLLYKIGTLTQKTNSNYVLDELLEVAIKDNNLQQLLILLDILSQQQRYAEVLSYIQDLEDMMGEEAYIVSIKAFCYNMLGRGGEAEIYITNGSPFYKQLLLQRIEGCWFQNHWLKAEKLLEELLIDGSIEASTISHYYLLHRILTQKELSYTIITEEEYEITYTLLENFLWLNQVEKAQLLLPLLLKQDERLIKLAELWALKNDYETIVNIFKYISCNKTKKKFVNAILPQLLKDGYIESAQKLAKIVEANSLGVLEPVLTSKIIIKNLKVWIEKLLEEIKSINLVEDLIPERSNNPSSSLIEFYYSLSSLNDYLENTTNNTKNLTSSKIHEMIGDYYINKQKKREAIFAYLRALQWDPLDYIVQEKVLCIYNDNQCYFSTLFEENPWCLEGSWFNCKEDFLHFIIGIISLKSNEFQKSINSFINISKNSISYTLSSAYTSFIWWITGEESEVVKFLKGEDKALEIITLFLHICKDYSLDILIKGHRLFPYSELIAIEREMLSKASILNFLDTKINN